MNLKEIDGRMPKEEAIEWVEEIKDHRDYTLQKDKIGQFQKETHKGFLKRLEAFKKHELL